MSRLAFSLISVIGVCASLSHAQETTELGVETNEAVHVFSVEIADTPEAIETGLMGRDVLDDNAGMLFDFGQPRNASMWMKDTPGALDMLFIGSDGRVLAIARNAVPQSERQISIGTAVRGVLEVRAGRSNELGIEPGARIFHPVFGTEIPEVTEAE